MSDRSKGKTANQPPVSAHPAFPVIVALWFAALLGIGSMVLPLDALERLSISSGLADSFAAAQPPFGATARIAVAVLAALIGGAAGVFVAGRVRAAQTPGTANARVEASQPTQTRFAAKGPISAHEELGEGGLDADDELPAAHEAPAGRRRALAVADDIAPEDFFACAPLPGQIADDPDEPLDLVAFEEPLAAEAWAEDVAESIEPPFDEGSEARFARATRFVQSEEPAIATPNLPERDPEPAAVPVAERPLGDLGVVELVERFALALQRHQAAASEARAPQPVAQDEAVAAAETGWPEEFHDANQDDAEALPDFEPAPAPQHNRGRFSAGFASALDDSPEEDYEDDEVAEASYPSLLAMKSPLAHREPVRIEDRDEAGVEAEPVAVFPALPARRAAPDGEGSARAFDTPPQRADNSATDVRHPARSGATERALRDALEKLQRMSGAA